MTAQFLKILAHQCSMEIVYHIFLVLLLVRQLVTATAFELLKEESLSVWRSSVQKLAPADLQLLLEGARKRITEQQPDSSSADNLSGMVSFIEERLSDSLYSFASSCQKTQFNDATIVRNWLTIWCILNTYSPRSILSSLIIRYPRSSALQQALVDELKLPVGREEAYAFLLSWLRKVPANYNFWLLFARMHTERNATFGADGRPGVGALLEEGLVQYGLTMFPRSPELNLLRALHLMQRDESDCAAYFIHLANASRSLDSGVIPAETYEQVAMRTAPATDPPNFTCASTQCTPYLGTLNRASFQAIHRVVDPIAGEGWNWLFNVSGPAGSKPEFNELVTSSVTVLLDHTGTPAAYLPSLQIGCNNVDTCALPGFFVADAMAAPSTHFVTQATDLSMVATGSVGLVYSSHTLEHLSHTLPPEHCITSREGVYRDGAAVPCEGEIGAALTEWRRVLVPGGRLLVSVPDLTALVTLWVQAENNLQERWYLMRFIYGGQIDEYDFHKVGFYEEMLWELLQSHGFCEIKRVQRFSLFRDASEYDLISLSVQAVVC